MRSPGGGRESGGELKQEHLPEQDGVHEHQTEMESVRKGLFPAMKW